MLENILHKYFGLEEDWNDEYEKQEENWNKAYNKLVQCIYDLGDLGVLPTNERIVDELDKIHSIGEENESINN